MTNDKEQTSSAQRTDKECATPTATSSEAAPTARDAAK